MSTEDELLICSAKTPKYRESEDILALSIFKFLTVEELVIVPMKILSRFDIVCPLPSRVLLLNVASVNQPLQSISAPSMIFVTSLAKAQLSTDLSVTQ